eukprot:1138119-Pelagomonas_calceolata.AAC.11
MAYSLAPALPPAWPFSPAAAAGGAGAAAAAAAALSSQGIHIPVVDAGAGGSGSCCCAACADPDGCASSPQGTHKPPEGCPCAAAGAGAGVVGAGAVPLPCALVPASLPAVGAAGAALGRSSKPGVPVAAASAAFLAFHASSRFRFSSMATARSDVGGAAVSPAPGQMHAHERSQTNANAMRASGHNICLRKKEWQQPASLSRPLHVTSQPAKTLNLTVGRPSRASLTTFCIPFCITCNRVRLRCGCALGARRRGGGRRAIRQLALSLSS